LYIGLILIRIFDVIFLIEVLFHSIFNHPLIMVVTGPANSIASAWVRIHVMFSLIDLSYSIVTPLAIVGRYSILPIELGKMYSTQISTTCYPFLIPICN